MYIKPILDLKYPVGSSVQLISNITFFLILLSSIFARICHNASMQNNKTIQSFAVSDVKNLDLVDGYDIDNESYRECLVSFEYDNMLWEGYLECDPNHLEDFNCGEIVDCEMVAPAHVEVAGMTVLMPR